MSTTSSGIASDRIAALLDENSFVEIGALVTARATDFSMKQNDTPSDGVVTGYGVINDNPVYVYSQDASVLGGSVGEMHAKKIANIYDLAMKTGAPVIGLIDCAGLRLQEATDALNGFGQIYAKQVKASGVVPQITAVFGSCGGGLSLIPTLTDFTFMEESKAKLFVNAPNALDGNSADKCDCAGAKFQSEEAGIVDCLGSEADMLARIRELVTMLPASNEADFSFTECTDDLNRTCADLEGCAGDTAIALSQIADDQVFFELKENYAKEMVTGFIRLNGSTIGCVANRTEVYGEDGKAQKLGGVLTVNGCEKAVKFIKFCDAFGIPVLTLTNVNGFEATVDAEKNMAKAAAKLTAAFAGATVAKVNVIVGNAYGSAYIAMNSKAIGADLTIAWQNAKIGMMDAKLAAKIICDGKGADEIDRCAAEYAELQSSVLSAAKRGYVDQLIDACDTRKYVIGAFEMLYNKDGEYSDKKHDTV
ncbi:MAG: carboxyl transferase [Lachnospiraceae bacterium]|nr:carboxyl transferase [Lachnospiraceae bacterium]MBD5483527.1 carboxyl transferase [Lachnospiraceae bacterium]